MTYNMQAPITARMLRPIASRIALLGLALFTACGDEADTTPAGPYCSAGDTVTCTFSCSNGSGNASGELDEDLETEDLLEAYCDAVLYTLPSSSDIYGCTVTNASCG